MIQLRLFIELAWGLVFGRGSGQTWRRAATNGAAFVATLTILVGGGVATMFAAEQSRYATGLGTVATTNAPTDLLMLRGGDAWRGQDIDVVWVEPADESTEPVLPRGMNRLPDPGDAVVSPALATLVTSNPALGTRYHVTAVLDWPGVTSGEDLVAYVRPPSAMLEALPQHLRIASFHGSLGGDQSRVFGSPPIDLSLAQLGAGELGLVVIPAIVLCLAGLAAKSPRRASRFELLRALGMSQRMLRSLSAIECVLAILPGTLLAVILWWVSAPWLTTIPFTGRRVVPGDLSWPATGYLLLICGMTIVAGVIGWMQPRRQADSSPRPTLRRHRITSWILLPLGLAGCVYAAMLFVNNRADADLALIGSGLAVVGVIAIVPALIRLTGALLGHAGDVSGFLAGRSLTWQPGWLAASFAGLAALVVTTVGVAGYAASIDYSEAWAQPRASTGPAISILQAPTQTTAEARRQLQARLPEATVVGLDIDDQGSRVTFTTGCQQLRGLTDLACDGSSATELSRADEHRVLHWLNSVGLASPETRVVLQQDGNPRALAVIGTAAPDQLDEQVREAGAAVLIISIVQTANVYSGSAGISWWLTAGLMLADVVLLLSCVLAVADRLLAAGTHHQNLHLIGAGDRQLHRLFSALFAAPYAVVVAASFAIGLFVCNVLRYRAPMPTPAIIWIAAGMVAIGVVGALASRRIATARLLASRD